MKQIIGLLSLLLTALLIWQGSKWVSFYFSSGSPGVSQSPKEFFLEVEKNSAIKPLVRTLYEHGIVSDPEMFYWYGKITRKNGKLKAGYYRFLTSMTPREVYKVLTSGISYAIPVTIPEGYNMYQIADILKKLDPDLAKNFRTLIKNHHYIQTLGFSEEVKTLEGYLFPETYLVGKATTAEELIGSMIRNYHKAFTPDLRERAQEIGLTEHQTITLASIVEKETGAPQERALVSSVFHNRLRKKMRLQTDPTVIYGIPNYNGNITKKHLTTYSPYNTYMIPGLPPGPIANPGKEAIRAALYPAQSEYLYFVSHNDGTHEFTSTFQDHSNAVKKFQLDAKARQGKSWRDLQK